MGAGLHNQVTDCGCFNRPGNNTDAGAIGRELIEERVLAAATNDVELVDLVPGRALKVEDMQDL